MASSPVDLLGVARILATETGELIVKAREGTVGVSATKSSHIDIVTEVDLAAERHLRQRIAELRPDDAVLGEEGQDTPGTSGVTWVLDPIDGTVNFLYGLPSYSVSVAAVTGPPTPEEWTIEAGAVYEGGTRSLWSAARGEGSWLDDLPLHRGPGPGPGLSSTLLGTGFQYIADRRALQGVLVAKMLPQVRDIRRLGSCALDICYVAAGRLDAYYEHGLAPWDFPAAALIALEAGVLVEGLDGAPPNTTLTLAALPGTFEALHDALKAAGAARLWDTP
ncbi:MAG: inositol monophosphatase [Demequinaceae bacterium]|nr:inositol monophosphatase [Demequinaceae bacterium]